MIIQVCASLFVWIDQNLILVSDEYLLPQLQCLIWGHKEGELGIKVGVGDSSSNGCEIGFHASCKILQFVTYVRL